METVLLSSCIGRQFITRHNTPEAALLQLCMQPGCFLSDAPQHPPVLFNVHWFDQASEPSLPHASLADFLDTNPPSINYLQKWYPTALFPSSFPSSTVPACSAKIHPTVKRPVRQSSWVLPYREAQVRSAWSGVGLYWVKPSIRQLYC